MTNLVIHKSEESKNWCVFNISDARKYGLNEAIVLNTLFEKRIGSLNELNLMFPIFSEEQIKEIIKSLEKQGLITNENKDHTLSQDTKR